MVGAAAYASGMFRIDSPILSPMKTSTEVQVADLLARLMQQLYELDQLSPNRFPALIEKAGDIGAWYAAMLELNYAANCKELRDTGDDRVHAICVQIRDTVDGFKPFFRVRLLPASPEQQQGWTSMVSREPSGKYAFRDDGSIEVGLLDSTLHGDLLFVGHVWNHVCNFDGSSVSFTIRLDEAQAAQLRTRFAESRLAQQAIMRART